MKKMRGVATMEILQLDHKAVLDYLPDRAVDSHKGNFGKILLLCGSRGYTGAAALAAMGALRCGAGLVYLGVPESVYPIVATKVTEPIVFPLSDEDGMLSRQAIVHIEDKLQQMDAVLIGPGLGRSEGTNRVLQHILKIYQKTLIIDADGINLLAEHKDLLRGRTGVTILTPHEGEFSRLTGAKITNRIDDAMNAASELRSIVVLKGHNTVITDGANCFVNPTGNPGMAVGGSGDVLAGMICALVGQGIAPLHAAACGVWLHGAAGDLCAEQLGQYAMLPSDMLMYLPRLLK